LEKGNPPDPDGGPKQVGDLSPAAPLPFNVQHVVISFIFGVLVAALVAMQWQALRRRRSPTANAPPAGQQTAADASEQPTEGIVQQAPPS
jgi:hypothetical protein